MTLAERFKADFEAEYKLGDDVGELLRRLEEKYNSLGNPDEVEVLDLGIKVIPGDDIEFYYPRTYVETAHMYVVEFDSGTHDIFVEVSANENEPPLLHFYV